ncbi:hypothetical protein, partial [Streptomyces brasiliscabiei]|uniref:hypothetical protein n=1 Tax=Streptomyces brasiliscabiei TaxID=2736302 RepID=UPI0030155B61
RENAKQIAFDLGRELINQAGPKAIFGCKITPIDKSGKAKGPGQFYSAAKAWNHYQNQICELFGGTEG